jgi:AcrR family transcriptional regulator
VTDTKTTIVNLAEVLILTKGYHAFSYKDISMPLNIKNAAVHYHFPSKADLGLEIIERTLKLFHRNTEKWNVLIPIEKLKAFIGIYESSQKRNLVCFMGALGPSFDHLPEVMQQALTTASKEILDWLKGVLAEGQSTGHFHFEETPTEKANMIVSSLLSSLILNKVTGDNLFGSVKDAILKSI